MRSHRTDYFASQLSAHSSRPSVRYRSPLPLATRGPSQAGSSQLAALSSEPSSPLRSLLRYKSRPLGPDLEDVEVATRAIPRIDDFVVRGLWLDLHREPVTLTTDAF